MIRRPPRSTRTDTLSLPDSLPICVGGEALVHHGQRRYRAGIGQVAVIAAHLVGQQQALVDHSTYRDRRNEIFLAMRQLHVLNCMAGGLAYYVQLALKGVGHHAVGTASNEQLTE